MKSRSPLIVAIALLFLPLLYVGSYLALVKPGSVYEWDLITGNRLSTNYRSGGKVSECIFWPLEQIDRKVRPGAWGPPGIGFELFEGPVSR